MLLGNQQNLRRYFGILSHHYVSSFFPRLSPNTIQIWKISGAALHTPPCVCQCVNTHFGQGPQCFLMFTYDFEIILGLSAAGLVRDSNAFSIFGTFLRSYSTFNSVVLTGRDSTSPARMFFSLRTINGKLKISKKRVTAGTLNRLAQKTFPLDRKRVFE